MIFENESARGLPTRGLVGQKVRPDVVLVTKSKLACSKYYASLLIFSASFFLPGTMSIATAHEDQLEQTIDSMDIESLLGMEVTSVSKKAQKLSDSPAAIFVITADDVRRSGVTNIPEALRVVPGLDVARIDANKWAVTARGFNGRFANKLLVLVDGRTVYSPVFSGVYWETQDLMLEDLDRIEVIRGPGATLWGANAVNGVINIITRHAADTTGVLLSITAGDEERSAASLRMGGKFAEKSYARAYLKTSKKDDFARANGDSAGDKWDMSSGGFRVDMQPSYNNNFTLQGDFYRANIDQELFLSSLVPPYFSMASDSVESEGWNLMGRWQHTQSHNSEYSFQVYVDHNDRNEAFAHQSNKSFDVDFQHLISISKANTFIWGLGYRYTESTVESTFFAAFDNPTRDDDLFNIFAQDEIELVDEKLWLTVGAKIEQNDYTGTEIQPNVRLMWAVSDRQRLWMSVSRAVRTASRAEHDYTGLLTVVPPMLPFVPFPTAVLLVGDEDYESEELLAWEAGYRLGLSSTLSLDMTVFFNDYNDLRNTKIGAPSFNGSYAEQPLSFDNDLSGDTAGFELAATWQAAEHWRWALSYSFIEARIDAATAQEKVQQGESPRHRLSLRSQWDVSESVEFDVWLRFVDQALAVDGSNALALRQMDAYVAGDMRLAWRPDSSFELALVGQNLFDSQHPEYVQESFTLPTEIERGFYLKATWQPK